MADTAEPVDLRALRMLMSAYRGEVKSLNHRVTLAAPPHEVYATLLDGDRMSDITGSPATIDPRVGGAVSLEGGKSEAIITELLDDRHIVFAWRPIDDRWPENHYTTATFMLRPEGKGTTVVFFQQGVPEALAADVAEQWQRSYWQPLAEKLG